MIPGQLSIFDYSFEDSTPKEMSNYKIKNKVRITSDGYEKIGNPF